jgi:hypothetical protein
VHAHCTCSASIKTEVYIKLLSPCLSLVRANVHVPAKPIFLDRTFIEVMRNMTEFELKQLVRLGVKLRGTKIH